MGRGRPCPSLRGSVGLLEARWRVRSENGGRVDGKCLTYFAASGRLLLSITVYYVIELQIPKFAYPR